MTDFISRWLGSPTVARLLIAAIGVALIMIVIDLLRRNVGRYVRDSSSRYRTRKFLGFTAYAAAAILLLILFSDKLGGLVVALGVAGAVVAFALQEVIGSVAGWLVILFGRIYRIGDRVQIGSIKGDVIDIGILRTTIMEIGGWIEADAYSGRIVKVSNFHVLKESVANYSGDFPFLWDEITIPVRYGSDYQLARDILYRTADEVVGEYSREAAETWAKMVDRYLVEAARTDPRVTLVANSNWVEYTLRYVVDYKDRRPTRDRIFTRILEEFAATGERVQFASTTIEMVNPAAGAEPTPSA